MKISQVLSLVFVIAYQCVLQVKATCSTGTYCSGGALELPYDLVFFEGSIGLYQSGIALMQKSTDPLRQSLKQFTDSTETTTVYRVWNIIRIANNTLDWDGNTNPQEVQNGFYSPLLQSATVTPYPFFKGNVVPFKTCSYMYTSWATNSPNNKYYGFARYMISIEYNTVTNLKQTLAYQDYYQVFTDNSMGSSNDIASSVMDIHFSVNHCGFFYFIGNYLHLKRFPLYDCTQQDPCDIDNPLINKDASTLPTMEITRYELHSSISASQTVYGHAFVNDVWLFYMTTSSSTSNFALFKSALTVGAAGTTISLGVTQIWASGSPTATLQNMVMFEMRGVAISLSGVAGYTQITTTDSFSTNTNSQITNPDDASAYAKLLQQTGEEYLFRPVYAVWSNKPYRLHFVTLDTDWTIYLIDALDGIDFYDFDVVITRYNLYNVLPGPTSTTDLSTLTDYSEFRVAQYNLRGKAEVQQIQWTFNECGDGLWIENEENCDDGNNVNGDGCDSTCNVETDWTCVNTAYTLSVCTPDPVVTCGNGVIDTVALITEECDLGTHNSDDCTGPSGDGTTACVHGCSATCTVNNGWTCANSVSGSDTISTCSVICGNMVLDTDTVTITTLTTAETCDLGVIWIEKETAANGFETNSNYASKTAVEKEQNPGCDSSCQEKSGWRCPESTYGTCTPYCGDGIMQGVIAELQTDADIALGRAQKSVDGDFDAYPQYTGLVAGKPVWTLHDSATYPIPVEQCDDYIYEDGLSTIYTGAYGSHGCDKMCQIVSGWTCEQYLLKIEDYEIAYYRSHCTKIRRRLEDIEEEEAVDFAKNSTLAEPELEQKKYKRRLDHNLVDPTAYYQLLPSEVITFANNAQVINPTIGMNGRPRIISTSDDKNVFGICYGLSQMTTQATDFVLTQIRTVSTGTYADASASTTISSPSFAGRHRGVIGKYYIVNTDLNTFQIYSYLFTDASNVAFSSIGTIDTTQNIMGAFEYYWWPSLKMMMARLDDGLNLQMFNFPSTIKDIFDNPGNYNVETQIDQTLIRPVAVTGQIVVRPIFINNYAIFFTTQTNGSGYLKVYKWNPVLLSIIDMSQTQTYSLSSSLYNKFSLVYFEASTCFVSKSFGHNTYFKYVLDETAGTLSSSTPSIDLGTFTSLTITDSNVVLLQAQPDPDTTTYGDVYLYFDSTAIYKVSYQSGTDKILLEAEILLPTTNYLDITSGNIDIGHQHIAIMSKAQCGVTASTDNIINPAVYYYTIADSAWTCVDLAVTEPTASSAWTYPL